MPIKTCYKNSKKSYFLFFYKKRKNFIEFQKNFESESRIQKEIKVDTELEILNGQKEIDIVD